MNETITIRIEDIIIHERFRKDNGDLSELALSICDMGLINPITVMDNIDGGYQLIAGLRRLEAMKELGCEEISACVLSPMDADEALMLELAENLQRKDFSSAEQLEYVSKIDAIETAKAKLRQRQGLKQFRDPTVVANWPQRAETAGRTREITAKAAGFSSATQMRRVKTIAVLKPELLEKIDRGKQSIYSAYKEATKILEFRRKGSCNGEPNTTDANIAAIDDPHPAHHDSKILPYLPQNADAHSAAVLYASAPAPNKPAPDKRFKEQFVPLEPVDAPSVSMFDTTTTKAQGSKTHAELMKYPVYEALYNHCLDVVKSANETIGRLRFRCENDARRIRAYEENERRMNKDIEKLEKERAELLELTKRLREQTGG